MATTTTTHQPRVEARMCFFTWVEAVCAQRRTRKIQAAMMRFLILWKQVTHAGALRRKTHQRVLKKYRWGMLQPALKRWDACTKLARADRRAFQVYRSGRSAMVMREWRLTAVRACASKTLVERSLSMRRRRCLYMVFSAWLHLVAERRREGSQFHSLVRRWQHRLMLHLFQAWWNLKQ
eukprot:gene31303-39334_t